MIVKKERIIIGMQCMGCEKILEETINQLDGIRCVKADFKTATLKVQFDEDKVNLESIQNVCASKGYSFEIKPTFSRKQLLNYSLAFLAFTAIFAILLFARKYGYQLKIPEINSQMGDGLIFLVGLLTGLHCVGMCGSFIIGYTFKDAEKGRSVFHSHLLYGVGKTVSYALIGALFGFLGSLFRITPFISGLSISLAGLFLILYGLTMFPVFSLLKKLRIKQPLAMTSYLSKKGRSTNSPFFIGFFSGLILGCGPLQVMYVMAAGNGDVLEGAKFLTLFGLGTLPALIGFGFIARLLSNAMTRHFIHASGIILILLGSMMLQKGLLRTSSGNEIKSIQPIHSCCEQVDKENVK